MNWLIWSSLHFSKAILLNLLRKSISSFDYSVPVFWSQAKQIVLWKESLKIKFCHHDFWNLQLLDTHVVLLAKNFLLKKFQQSLFLWRLMEQKRLFCYRWNATKILFSLFCWNENRPKLSIHFELQVTNLWTNFAEIWPTYCHIVVLKNCACKVWFVSSFLSIFSQTYVILIFICSQQKNNIIVINKIWKLCIFVVKVVKKWILS